MNNKLHGLGAAAAAAALIVGGAAVAKGGTTETAGIPIAAASAPTSSGQSQADDSIVPDQGAPGPGNGGPGRGGAHTPATADETAKVTAAVKAKDPTVTVNQVLKDPDGTFDARGTKTGNPIDFEVSADYKTVTERTMGPGRPFGGPGSHRWGGGPGAGQHTPATADQTAKVTAAVKAKDPAVTVNQVLKDPDGTFDARGTKAGNRIDFEVSADYKTVTERTMRPGGPGGMRNPGTAVTGAELTKVTAAVKAKDPAVTVTQAFKTPDGTYLVLGTKGGDRIAFTASADLKTVTELMHR